MSKKHHAVAVPETKAVTAPMTAQDWGDDVTVGSDLVIAKILPMQLPSKLVGDGKAVFGEFRDSLTGAKLAGVEEPFLFLPFHAEKFWDIEEEQADGKFKWTQALPINEKKGTAGYNDDLEWKDVVAGKNVKRTRRLVFYGLLAHELVAGKAMPYTLAFKSMSLREGKKLLNQMYVRNRRANLPPCGFHVVITGVKTSNDKGKFIVPTMELGPQAKQEEVAEAFYWYKMIKEGKVKVDESMDDAITTDIPDIDISDTAEF